MKSGIKGNEGGEKASEDKYPGRINMYFDSSDHLRGLPAAPGCHRLCLRPERPSCYDCSPLILPWLRFLTSLKEADKTALERINQLRNRSSPAILKTKNIENILYPTPEDESIENRGKRQRGGRRCMFRLLSFSEVL